MQLSLVLVWVTLSFIVVGVIMLLLQPSLDSNSLIAIINPNY